MQRVELADVGDLGSATGGVPWWVSAGGLVIGAITAASPFVRQRWLDRHADTDTASVPGINAAVVATVTETTKPRGMSGVQLTTMLQTVELLSDRLEAMDTELADAKREIEVLKRHDSQRQWAYDQAIAWGINATGPVPRVVPPFLAQFMTNPPGAQT